MRQSTHLHNINIQSNDLLTSKDSAAGAAGMTMLEGKSPSRQVQVDEQLMTASHSTAQQTNVVPTTFSTGQSPHNNNFSMQQRKRQRSEALMFDSQRGDVMHGGGQILHNYESVGGTFGNQGFQRPNN